MQTFDSLMEILPVSTVCWPLFCKCISNVSLIQHLICVGFYFNFLEKNSQYVRNYSVTKIVYSQGTEVSMQTEKPVHN